MNSSTRNEIELRAELLRRKYTERELRTMFADRSHDETFAAVARPMFAGSIAIDDHILVWTGFEIAVSNEHNPLLPTSVNDAKRLYGEDETGEELLAKASV